MFADLLQVCGVAHLYALKGEASDEHHTQHHTSGPYVCLGAVIQRLLLVGGLGAQQLWRHVVRGALVRKQTHNIQRGRRQGIYNLYMDMKR